MNIYIDTSAYLCLVLRQGNWKQIKLLTKQNTLYSSTLLVVEAQRSLMRLFREGYLDEDTCSSLLTKVEADQEKIILQDFTKQIAATLLFPAVTLPRSLDLIHLRTAIYLNQTQGKTHFLTCDQAQKKSALEFQLTVVEA